MRGLGLVSAYTVPITAFSWPLVPRLGTHLVGGSGDTWLLFWNIWWFRQALFYEPTWPFYTRLLLHPEGVSLALSPPTLLNTIPAALLGLVLSLTVVYNLLVLANLVLAAAAMHLLTLRVVQPIIGHDNRPATAVAGFAGLAYALSPFHIAHLSHLNIFTIWVLPVLVWCVLRWAEAPTRWRAVQVGAALGCCGLADSYVLVQGFLLALLVWFLLRPAGSRLPRLRNLAPLGGAFFVLLLPLIVPVLQYGRRAFTEVGAAGGSNEYVADVLSYVLPSPLHPLWGAAMQPAYEPLSGNIAESLVFPTYTIWILAALAWRWRHARARRWGLVAGVFILLSFGPYLHVAGRSAILVDSGPVAALRLPLPKLLLDQLPLLSGARSAGRFAASGQLALVLMAACGLAHAVRVASKGAHDAAPAASAPDGEVGAPSASNRISARRISAPSASILALAYAALTFECLAVPFPGTQAAIPEAYDILRHEIRETGASGALLEIPPVHRDDKIYEFYQSAHGLPIVSGRFARGRVSAYDQLQRDPFLARLRDPAPFVLPDGLLALDGLDSLGVGYVMVHGEYDPRASAIVRILEREFERIPTPPGGPQLLRRRARGRSR